MLHQSTRRWPYDTSFHSLIDMPAKSRGLLEPFQPNFRHMVVDLAGFPMESVAGDWKLRATLSAMQAARNERIKEWFETQGECLDRLAAEADGAAFLRTVLQYLM